MDCLFCSIVEKKIPSKKVYEDDFIYAFEDIDPKAPVHIVAIPKKHIQSMADLVDSDSVVMGKLMVAVSKIAEERKVSSSGFRIVANTGADGGQTVDHLHIHLLAGRQMKWPPG